MTKYTVANRRRARTKDQGLPPIWRGVGCLLMLFIPLLSYALAVWVVGLAVSQHWPMPYQLMGFPDLPPLLSRSGIAPLVAFIEGQQNLYAILLATLILIVALGTLVSLVYSIAYKIVGPPRYGPLDAPPPKVGVRTYKR